MITTLGTVVLTFIVLFSTYSDATSRCSQPSTSGGALNDNPSSITCSQEYSDELSVSSEEVNALAQVLSEGGLDAPLDDQSNTDAEHSPFQRNTRLEGSTNLAFGSNPEHKYMRFGREPDHKFMRFGREPDHKFMRFGREPDHKFMRFGREPDHKFMRFGREPDHKFMRFGREPDHKFMRFGREPDHKFMRFGRETDPNFMRNQREPQHNFMRFGRSVDSGVENNYSQLIKRNNPEDDFMRAERQPDHKFMRFGRQPDHKFMRFGRQPDHKFMRFGRGFETPTVNTYNLIPSELFDSFNKKLDNTYQEPSQDKDLQKTVSS